MAKKKSPKQTNGRSAPKKAAEKEVQVVDIPLVREYPPGQVGMLANNFVVQHDGPEFHLLFFQTQPPVILGETKEEVEAAVRAIRDEGAKSVCVARIVVSAERLPSFIQAMQDVKRYGLELQFSCGLQAVFSINYPSVLICQNRH